MKSQTFSICIMGSTGSIGTQTLEVLRENPNCFTVESLSAHRNVELLYRQVLEFHPKRVCVGDEKSAHMLASKLHSSDMPEILVAEEGLSQLAAGDYDILMLAIVGFAALRPLSTALRSKRHIAIANKESLVAAGSLVKEMIDLYGGRLVPVDSEHNSVFQCMKARQHEHPNRVFITASGGPFREMSMEELSKVTPEMAVRHPNWDMGAKISVDSATLMNKGLELIEASVLFDLRDKQLGVYVHPQSIVHALVEYKDASTIAVLYHPSMKVPILNALMSCALEIDPKIDFFNNIKSTHASLLDTSSFSLDFLPPDELKFPCLRLCREALVVGGATPLILNTANEMAVSYFIEKRIRFTDIPVIISRAIEHFSDKVSFSDIDSLFDSHLCLVAGIKELLGGPGDSVGVLSK